MRFTTLCGGLFARLLYGAVHNIFNVTRRIHRCTLEVHLHEKEKKKLVDTQGINLDFAQLGTQGGIGIIEAVPQLPSVLS